MRGAPHVVPSADLGVFTMGALPVDRVSFKQSLGGWSDALEEAGLDVFETLDRMVTAARALLDGRTMNVNELRDRIYARVRALSKVKRPSFARDDMPEPLFRAVGTSGAACIVAGRGTNADLARTDQWLQPPPPALEPAEARAELARRFLHCYGPATAQHFADWTERSLADAREGFSLIEEELVEIPLGRSKAWLLNRDQNALSSPPQPSGVRLLPVQDPYLQQRDRATVLPDEQDRRRLWQAVRGPGGVLVDGEIVGTWRPRKAGAKLKVLDGIEAGAERIAPFRGCETAEVSQGS
jgi:hypothetical protein